MPRRLVALGAAAAAAAAAAFAAVALSSSGPPGDELRQAVGAYRFADGTVVALVPQPSGAGLRLVDYATGAMRDLSEVSHDRFGGGPGVHVPRPVEVRVRLVRNAAGKVVALRRAGSLASRIPIAAIPASFHDGGVSLAGRLLLPPGSGPRAAVVLVPGSVAATRDTYDLWAYYFASEGLAVLSYDKRGVGESSGRYVEAPTEDNLRAQAGDALAAVEWLRTRPEIDPGRIGLSGGSQAGFAIPLAASESADVAFAAIQSGPVTSVYRQQAYGSLTEDGARVPPPTEAEIRAALAAAPDGGFDPRPALRALQIPVLWQLGGVDKRAYTPESVANLEAITSAAPHDFTVHVYPAGAHSLRWTRHGLVTEELRSPGFVPGLFADLGAWLRAHGL